MQKGEKILFAWDFHGTLEKDNVYAVYELCNLVLKEFGYEKQVSMKEVLDWQGLSWFDYFKLSVPSGSDKIWREMVNRVLSLQEKGWEIIKKYIKPRDFAREVLFEIKSKGHENILLTNSEQAHAEKFAAAVGISDLMDGVIGVDTHRQTRINKEIHNIKGEVLRNFLSGKEYSKVVMIGDKESDVKAGKSCGAVTYLFSGPEVGSAKETTADHKINDLREVLKEL
jgi:phosphoglycolate phosphatase-like HAD superfamily hydrolase